MKYSVSVLLTSLLFVTAPAWGHTHKFFTKGCASCPTTGFVAVEVAPDQTELTKSQRAELIHMVHEAFEGDTEGMTFFQKLVDKFRFPSIASRFNRLGGAHADQPALKNFVPNITVAFAMSHSTEVVGGCGTIGYALVHSDLALWERLSMIGGAVVVMLPGTDPLCYLTLTSITGAYVVAPKLIDRILTIPRVLMQKGATSIGSKRLRERLEDSFVQIEAAEAGYRLSFFTPDGRPTATLEMEAMEKKRMGLRRIEIPDGPSDREVADSLRIMGWNIGGWAVDLRKAKLNGRMEWIKGQPFVEDVEVAPDGFRVTTKTHSFSVPDACGDILAAGI